MVNRKYVRKLFAAALAMSLMMGSLGVVNGNALDSVDMTGLSLSENALSNDSYVSMTTIGVGKILTIYGAASGGSGDYSYAYFYKKSADTKWVTKKNFSTVQSVSIAPNIVTVYDVCVKVRDNSTGQISKRYFSVKVNPALQSKSSVSSKTITKGQKITMTGSATGGSGNYTYAYFYRRNNSSWIQYKNFTSANSAVITPAYSGTYEICIKAKDSYGTVVKNYFTVTVKQLVNNSYLGAEIVKFGESVVLAGSAGGGNGSYSYAYFAKKKSASSWKTLKNFSSVKFVDFVPTELGQYDICIKVKDVTGTIEKKYLTLNVVDSSSPAAEIVAGIIDGSMTEVQKIKAIHDWLVNNVQYDTEGYTSGNISDECYTAEGLFKNRIAVCDGYAKAFVLMAEYAGFEAERVTGVGFNKLSPNGESHAWNQVKVDGNWYNIDVTWDDPISANPSIDNLRYTYFLVPDSVMGRDHFADDPSTLHSCTQPQPLDELLTQEMTAHSDWHYCETPDEVGTVAKNCADSNITDFTVIYKADNFDCIPDIGNAIFDSSDKILGRKMAYQTWKMTGYIYLEIHIYL